MNASDLSYRFQDVLIALRQKRATDEDIERALDELDALRESRYELDPEEWSGVENALRKLLRDLNSARSSHKADAHQVRTLANAVKSLLAPASNGSPPPVAPTITSQQLADIASAARGQPGLDEERLSRAIAKALGTETQRTPYEKEDAILEALKDISHRLKGLGAAFGPAGPSEIQSNPARELGRVTVTSPVEVSNDEGNPLPVSGLTVPELEELTALTSAARTATTPSTSFTNRYYSGLRLYLDVTAVSGTLPTLDVKVQTREPIRGSWVDMANTAFPQVNAAGTWVLVVYPGINQTTVGTVVRVSNVMSRTWRVLATIGGTAPSFTFSVAGVYLP